MATIWQAAIVFAIAFGVAYACVPLAKRLANSLGAIDYPSDRRINTTPIPRTGGIAIYAGFCAGCLVVAVGTTFFGWGPVDLVAVRNIDYVLLFCGLSIVFLVGLIDDVTPLSPRSKLAGQILGALVICMSGVTIGAVRWLFTGNFVDLQWLDWPLTIVYLLVFMNITNLIDGLDGLAAGIVAITSVGYLVLVLGRGSFILAMMCVAVLAVCLAFLRFNFNPASIFMGDSGALFLGAILAVVSTAGVVRTQGIAMLLVPVVIAGVPAMDTLSAIVRRTREGKRIDEADMGHLHHRLVAAGFGQRRSVLVLYAVSAAMMLVGLFLTTVSGPVRWLVFAVLAVVIGVVVWRLHLFDPVLQHYYRRRSKTEPRRADNLPGEDADACEADAAGAAGEAHGAHAGDVDAGAADGLGAAAAGGERS